MAWEAGAAEEGVGTIEMFRGGSGRPGVRHGLQPGTSGRAARSGGSPRAANGFAMRRSASTTARSATPRPGIGRMGTRSVSSTTPSSNGWWSAAWTRAWEWTFPPLPPDRSTQGDRGRAGAWQQGSLRGRFSRRPGCADRRRPRRSQGDGRGIQRLLRAGPRRVVRQGPPFSPPAGGSPLLRG